MQYRRVVFFQPRTMAQQNYSNSAGQEQRWVPWFAPALSPAARRLGLLPILIDARLEPETWEKQVRALGPTDIFAVTVMTGHAIRDAIRASRIAMARHAFVVWGGPHVTLFPEQTLDEAPVDACIQGFGFPPFSSLLEKLISEPHNQFSANGVYFKVPMPGPNNNPVTCAESELPPYDLDIIENWEAYLNEDVAIATKTVSFVTSEGCPRRCTFCSEPTTSGGKWLVRDIDQVTTGAVEVVEKSGANGLKLHDPNFFHDTNRALAFASKFKRVAGLPWAATIYPDDLLKMSEETLSLFAQSGLSRVLIGLESPVPQLVRLAGKQYDPEKIPVLAQRLAKHQIRGMFTFIVGWPGAEPDHYQLTIDSAFGIKAIWSEHQAKIHFLEPWPGTPIFKLATRFGLETPESLTDWANIDYYQAQYMSIHDISVMEAIRDANAKLSPYVNA